MAKSGHKEGADNSDDVKQVIETVERECGISQDVIKNSIDKMHPIREMHTLKGKNIVVSLFKLM